MMWKYKGTKRIVQTGDKVLISQRLADENKVSRHATVVGLHGFITVKLSDGENMDVDARMITFDSV